MFPSPANPNIRLRPFAILAAALACLVPCARGDAPVVLVEAESFTSIGGWKVDTQSVEQMGSVYLMAHGLGNPVEDARAMVALPAPGSYRLWVRTRNWAPGPWEAPGKFSVLVNGTAVASTFGTESEAWHWQDGGAVELDGPAVELKLRDLTGFNGRCDAIALVGGDSPAPPNEAAALKAWRRTVKNEALAPEDQRDFDCVITGGGMAGCCAALAAARSGVKVALIQDRPVLGGNASQEIRVGTRGEIRHPIVDEIDTLSLGNRDNGTINADANRLAKIRAEANITLLMPWRAEDAGTDPATGRITHVDARQTQTHERVRLRAPLFVDCTGDGWIGYWAGADYRMGWEASSEFNESLGKPVFTAMTLGNSLMWKTKTGAAPSVFPAVPWAMDVAGTRADTGGDWNWEYGMRRDTIAEAEEIRDHLLRAIFGNFSNAKKSAANANLEFDWVPFIAGKRESRRLMGDTIVTQNDMVNGTYYEDAVGTTDWGIDLHYETSTSYLSNYQKTTIAKPSYFPYRSLYSRNVPNLFMAGRNFSCTHAGLGSPRVMNTTGQMGVAVGYAAAMCLEYGLPPRDIYRIPERMLELQARITGKWPARPVPTGFVVDNADATGVIAKGTWIPSTSVTGFHGLDYLYAPASTAATGMVAFTPAGLVPETYTIALKWTSAGNRASNTPVWVFTGRAPAHDLEAAARIALRSGASAPAPAAGDILVGRHAPGDYGRGLLSFATDAIPPLAILRSAQLVLTIGDRDATSTTGPAGAEGLKVFRVTEAFTPGQATWQDRSTGTAWSVAGGSTEATALAALPTPTDPSQVVAGQSFLLESAALLAAVESARALGTPLDLLVRTPTLESTYPARKLYQFSAATLRLGWFVPALPATATVNQRVDNGQWMSIGNHAVDADGVTVVVGNPETNGYVVADAVQFTPPGGASDRDGDGLPDWWERWHFISETAAVAASDSDGDGRSNQFECRTGTNPLDPMSRFEARAAFESQARTINLRWPSADGLRYRVESSPDCLNWTTRASGIAATPPENQLTLPTGDGQAFFRVGAEGN